MSEKLRRRFVLVAVLCVFVVLLMFLAIINIWNYQNVLKSADGTLDMIAANDGYYPKPPKDKKTSQRFHPMDKPEVSPEAPFFTRYFSVILDESGAELQVNTGSIAAISTKEAGEMATAALNKGKEKGTQGIYRYTIAKEDGRTLVVFLDCTRDFYTVGNFVLNSIYVGAAGFLAVSLLIIIFSKAAVRPVAESYEKQKIFITNAGHELKTPLSIIQANCEVLEVENGESQWTNSIHNQVDRMTRLTAQLTTLAKMEEDRGKEERKDVDFSVITKEVCGEMEAFAQSYGKSISFKGAEKVMKFANESQLSQLVYILLDNGIKHGTAGSPIEVTLNAAGKLTVKNKAHLEKEGDLNILLERFTRADDSRSRDTGGYGLGLSIAKAIVESHKGKIKVFATDKETMEITVKL